MGLKTMDLQLVGLYQSTLDEPVANLGALITLELQHFSVLGMLYHCAITGKFLEQ